MKKGSNTKKVFTEENVEEVLTAIPVEDEPVAEEPEIVEAEVVTTGIVIAKMLNVRPEPSMSKDPLRILYEGDKVEYTVENDEWYKLTNGGFVMAKYIQ